jgi:hypothetical protein
MRTQVTDEQFEWRGDDLVHVPTGASFEPRTNFVNFGDAGNVLPDGRDFDRGDVLAVARRLMAERHGEASVMF